MTTHSWNFDIVESRIVLMICECRRTLPVRCDSGMRHGLKAFGSTRHQPGEEHFQKSPLDVRSVLLVRHRHTVFSIMRQRIVERRVTLVRRRHMVIPIVRQRLVCHRHVVEEDRDKTGWIVHGGARHKHDLRLCSTSVSTILTVGLQPTNNIKAGRYRANAVSYFGMPTPMPGNIAKSLAAGTLTVSTSKERNECTSGNVHSSSLPPSTTSGRARSQTTSRQPPPGVNSS